MSYICLQTERRDDSAALASIYLLMCYPVTIPVHLANCLCQGVHYGCYILLWNYVASQSDWKSWTLLNAITLGQTIAARPTRLDRQNHSRQSMVLIFRGTHEDMRRPMHIQICLDFNYAPTRLIAALSPEPLAAVGAPANASRTQAAWLSTKIDQEHLIYASRSWDVHTGIWWRGWKIINAPTIN